MNTRLQFAALAPLLIAAAALGIRETTRTEALHSSSEPKAAEFVPPPLFTSASRAPGVAQVLAVDSEASHATLSGVAADGRRATVDVAVEGTLAIDAAEASITLDIALLAHRGEAAQTWPTLGRIALRGESVLCRATPAPGTRACDLRARWSAAGHVSESTVVVTWLRLPGGLVRLQGVIPIDALHARERWWSGGAGDRGHLAFDLTLRVRA